MPTRARAAAVSLMFTAAPALALPPPEPPDPMVATIQQGAKYVRTIFTAGAEQMSEADYAFRPTPAVRSFGELLAHVADTNFGFCANAIGQTPPAGKVEKTKTNRAAIRQALEESFELCERAFAKMTDAASAEAMRSFQGRQLPALAVLNFRNYHALVHWGNAITYMRLRGKVPPLP